MGSPLAGAHSIKLVGLRRMHAWRLPWARFRLRHKRRLPTAGAHESIHVARLQLLLLVRLKLLLLEVGAKLLLLLLELHLHLGQEVWVVVEDV